VSLCPYDLRWWGSSVEISFFPHPEDLTRSTGKKGHSSSFSSGARCIYPFAPVTNFDVTWHLPLTSCTLRPRSEIRKENVSQILLREAVVSKPGPFFFLSHHHCVFCRFLKIESTIALSTTNCVTRPFSSCSDFLRKANRYKLVDIYDS